MRLSSRDFLGAAVDYLWILAGTFITAIALDVFLVPNKIAAGGVSGLATVTYYLFGWPVGATMLAINIPLLIAGIRSHGGSFGVRSLFGGVALSAFVDLLEPHVGPLTRDALLAAVYGGALSGVGLGLAFRHGGSTGGTDLAARLLDKMLPISTGQALFIIDFMVITLAGIVFDAELALYALITLFVTGKVVDVIQEGAGYARAAFIISTKTEEISQAVLKRMERGATIITARGAYTGLPRDVLLCSVARFEITTLKNIVKEIDPKAFVIIAEVHEVLGEGFKTY